MEDGWLDTSLSNEEYWRLKKQRRLEQEQYYFLKKKHEQIQAMQLFLDGTADDDS